LGCIYKTLELWSVNVPASSKSGKSEWGKTTKTQYFGYIFLLEYDSRVIYTDYTEYTYLSLRPKM
jgi:hypothetical protein